MKVGIEIAIAVCGVAFSGVVGHFVARAKLKDEIHKLNLEIEKLKSRDEIQQIVIDSFKQQAEQLIPVLIEELEKKNKKKKKNG